MIAQLEGTPLALPAEAAGAVTAKERILNRMMFHHHPLRRLTFRLLSRSDDIYSVSEFCVQSKIVATEHKFKKRDLI